jgi:hypothetical protein
MPTAGVELEIGTGSTKRRVDEESREAPLQPRDIAVALLDALFQRGISSNLSDILGSFVRNRKATF